MLDRARAYNSDPDKPYYVQRLRIFGSYLDKSIDPLGDVDIELVLGQRTTDTKKLLRYATASGRSFPTFTDHLLWPQMEVVHILRNRSAAISITMEDIERLTVHVMPIYSISEDDSAAPPPPPPLP